MMPTLGWYISQAKENVTKNKGMHIITAPKNTIELAALLRNPPTNGTYPRISTMGLKNA